jgi:hypothetical protein
MSNLFNTTEQDNSNIANLKVKDWRMTHLYKIVNKNSDLVTFVPNTSQRHFLSNRHTRNVILKSRRLGFTTFSTVDMLDNTLFTQNFNSLFISYDDPSAKKVFDEIAMLAWGHFPLKNMYQVDLSNANMLKLNFGNDTYSGIEIKSSGRGGRYNQIHISEFGKICAKYPQKAQEIISGTIPSLTPSGTLTIESTAEGEGGFFHDMFWDAWDKTSSNIQLKAHEYKAHFYNWQWDLEEIGLIKLPDAQIPKDFLDYQREHNEKAKKFPSSYRTITDLELTFWFYKFIQLGRKWSLLLQEYPTTPEEAFVSSGSKMFDAMQLEKQKEFEQDPNVIGDWRFYEDPRPNHNYVIGADPSEGVGGDHSAAVIIDFTSSLKKPKVVATYANNKIPPDLFAYEIKNQGTAYNYALAMVERNNTGHATLTQLKQIYPVECIYKEENESREDNVQTERLGWHTNLITKPKMFYELSTAFNEVLIEVPDKSLVHEARVYDRNELGKTKADPDATNHFDKLTALAIAFQGRTQIKFLSTDVVVSNPRSGGTASNPYSWI